MIIETSTAERIEEMNKMYSEFMEHYYNSDLSVRAICDEMAITFQGGNHKQIRKCMKENGVIDPRRRWSLICQGEWGNWKYD